MAAPVNRFKQSLKEGRQTIGCWLTQGTAIAAEIAATADFDWLLTGCYLEHIRLKQQSAGPGTPNSALRFGAFEIVQFADQCFLKSILVAPAPLPTPDPRPQRQKQKNRKVFANSLIN